MKASTKKRQSPCITKAQAMVSPSKKSIVKAIQLTAPFAAHRRQRSKEVLVSAGECRQAPPIHLVKQTDQDQKNYAEPHVAPQTIPQSCPGSRQQHQPQRQQIRRQLRQNWSGVSRPAKPRSHWPHIKKRRARTTTPPSKAVATAVNTASTTLTGQKATEVKLERGFPAG